jgi:hypothetical protein
MPSKLTHAALQTEEDMLAQIPRPKAPVHYKLTAEENAEWESVVGALPPNWFARESFGILAEYVRAVVRSRDFQQSVKELKKAKDWYNARFMSIEQRKITDQVKKLATTLSIASRANTTTRHKVMALNKDMKAAIRRDVERNMPTIQHASPWNDTNLAVDYTSEDQAPAGAPWDKRGAAREAIG